MVLDNHKIVPICTYSLFHPDSYTERYRTESSWLVARTKFSRSDKLCSALLNAKISMAMLIDNTQPCEVVPGFRARDGHHGRKYGSPTA
ncbi:uncharacterized protein RCC_03435 [Ramularia collo-cygni]|uniref:Uncharacterized protein n=1 Tax=Ramularia collo-cygni TaxID=112498 RepID=A0A2D3UPY4_9PEZI|nr:uncharacterized protein RCC_03435 [Ramularia collo-cygni]CZT17601.1 uncharacterized protein RCC_03435 [Ramularia collo-cygni]